MENDKYITLPLAANLAYAGAVTINSSGQWAAAGQAATAKPVAILKRGGASGEAAVGRSSIGKLEGIAAATLTNSVFAVGEVVYTAASNVLTNVSTSATALGICVKGGAPNAQIEWVPYL